MWQKESIADAMRLSSRAGACGRWETEGSVACGVAHQVYALDAASGGLLWHVDTGGARWTAPAVEGWGPVFVGSLGDRKVRVADPPGRLTVAVVAPCCGRARAGDAVSRGILLRGCHATHLLCDCKLRGLKIPMAPMLFFFSGSRPHPWGCTKPTQGGCVLRGNRSLGRDSRSC